MDIDDENDKTPEILLTKSEIRKRLDEIFENMKVKDFAALAGVLPQEVSAILSGRREPSAKVLAAMGYRKFVGYAPIDGFDDSHLFPLDASAHYQGAE